MYKVKRPLKRWRKFTIITKPITWDEKWIYFEQQIVSGGKVMCTAVISVIVIGKNQKIPTAEALKALKFVSSPPPFSNAVHKFIEAEAALSAVSP